MVNPTPLLLMEHFKMILETEKDITFARLPHKLISVIQNRTNQQITIDQNGQNLPKSDKLVCMIAKQ